MLFLSLKLLHIFFICLAVGAFLVQYVIVARYMRSEDTALRRASESIALTSAQILEQPGLIIALLSGLALSFVNTGYWSAGGFLHAKTLFVVILLGLSHMAKARLKKIKTAAEQVDEVGVNTHKKKVLLFYKIQLIVVLIIMVLILFKPF